MSDRVSVVWLRSDVGRSEGCLLEILLDHRGLKRLYFLGMLPYESLNDAEMEERENDADNTMLPN